MERRIFWKKDVCRDLIALASLTFYIIVMVRALAGSHFAFLTQLAFALVISYAIGLGLANISKLKLSQRVSRAVILLIFVSFFYGSYIFTIFAIILFIAISYSIIYLKKNTTSQVIQSMILGVISSGVAYGLYLIS